MVPSPTHQAKKEDSDSRCRFTVVGRGRTLHDLRHTAACEWITQGVPLTTVQAWLGHSSIEITSRYLHHLGDFADRAALQLLNQAPPTPATPPSAAATPSTATPRTPPHLPAQAGSASERARRLPDLSAFGGRGTSTRPTPGRGIGY
jgi:hypothetical protein